MLYWVKQGFLLSVLKTTFFKLYGASLWSRVLKFDRQVNDNFYPTSLDFSPITLSLLWTPRVDYPFLCPHGWRCPAGGRCPKGIYKKGMEWAYGRFYFFSFYPFNYSLIQSDFPPVSPHLAQCLAGDLWNLQKVIEWNEHIEEFSFLLFVCPFPWLFYLLFSWLTPALSWHLCKDLKLFKNPTEQ